MDTASGANDEAGSLSFQKGARNYLSYCSSCPLLSLGTTAVLALAILLLVRPPFVLLFEHDKTRPWRGKVRVSWMAVFVVLLVTLLIATGLPLLVEMAARTVVGSDA